MKTVALAMTDRDEGTDEAAAISAFMRGYSIEATRPTADDIAALAGIVPAGTSIYVSAVPAQRADEAVEHAARLRKQRVRAGAASRGARVRERRRDRSLPGAAAVRKRGCGRCW